MLKCSQSNKVIVFGDNVDSHVVETQFFPSTLTIRKVQNWLHLIDDVFVTQTFILQSSIMLTWYVRHTREQIVRIKNSKVVQLYRKLMWFVSESIIGNHTNWYEVNLNSDILLCFDETWTLTLYNGSQMKLCHDGAVSMVEMYTVNNRCAKFYSLFKVLTGN